MRSDFCVFVLTHGRPDKLYTLNTLKKSGYTGKVYLVIDDEDKTADRYKELYGDMVLQFSKVEIGTTFDEGDNFDDRRTITYARNVCFELAKKVGCRLFIELDDDYSGFYIRFNSAGKYGSFRVKTMMDSLLNAMIDFYESIPALSIALSQGGDHIGGGDGNPQPRLMRKCMNSFICSVDRPFQFRGRFNEDVNTYTTLGRQGHLFFTVLQAQLNQKATQSNPGGITDLYKKFGTYVKSFNTIQHAPSCVKVGEMGDPRSPNYRIHHVINWGNCAPRIIREDHRK